MDMRITTIAKWTQIHWKLIHHRVEKLQHKIYRHSLNGEMAKVQATQKNLINSFSAKLLAVRRVTQNNRGKNTAGVDGVKSLNPQQRMKLAKTLTIDGLASPIRRVWIPKPGTTEMRPLGIPTMHDRAKQALTKMALEPEWEAKFEPNSYGFRPGRSCHDAIEAIYLSINRAPTGKYVLDADIQKCFDSIDHDVLVNKLGLETWPLMRRQVYAWLKAGVMDAQSFTPLNSAGTPQGGVISPLLANIALHGVETMLKQMVKTMDLRATSGIRISPANRANTISIIRYADDFVVLHKDHDVIIKAKQHLDSWLSELALELKPSKTRLVHTDSPHDSWAAGFDFLGFNIRRYASGKYSRGKRKLNSKTLIKPSKKAIKNHLDAIKAKLKYCVEPSSVIRTLNPVIRGWCNFYRSVVSKRIFNICRQRTYDKLMAWARRKHAYRSRAWIYAKYYTRDGTRLKFTGVERKQQIFLYSHDETKIVRHVKVKGSCSVYDGNISYWSNRYANNMGLSKRVTMLLKKQRGQCASCGLMFSTMDTLEVDHIMAKSDGGKDNVDNLQLLHGHCHDTKHATPFKASS